ncbi:MAG: metal-sulfur cluster assembly factor [Candidatus Micrarchaeota archaeon]|nr:metal-sulfur cluster assembly factor [Candidatus Micrarchaeota archaeon]
MDEKDLRKKIIEALKQVKDPEFNYNIVEMGIVYRINVDKDKKHADVVMSLTTPFCPYGGSILSEVQEKLRGIQELDTINVDVVFEPAWNPDFMHEEPEKKLLETGVFK